MACAVKEKREEVVKYMFANFFEFGEKTAREIIPLLFFIGMVPIAFYAIVTGRIAALTFRSLEVYIQKNSNPE